MGSALLTPLISPPMSSLDLSSPGLLASSQSLPRGSVYLCGPHHDWNSPLSVFSARAKLHKAGGWAGLGCLPGWLEQSLAQSRASVNVCGNKCSSWVVRTPYFSLHCVSKGRSSTKFWGQLEDASPGSRPGRALPALIFSLPAPCHGHFVVFHRRRESESLGLQSYRTDHFQVIKT